MHDIAQSNTFPGQRPGYAETHSQAPVIEGACGLLVVGICSAFLAAVVSFLMGAGLWMILTSYALGGGVGMALTAMLQMAVLAPSRRAKARQPIWPTTASIKAHR
ncbi:hypothetical protein [Marinovum sp.]|uniref:hypothetical protein n=1 Tax=Marinovum sp. TaxID=2024839 RepID=UPI002B2705A2|nr:hypothetical protein [Marinovum sp.]